MIISWSRYPPRSFLHGALSTDGGGTWLGHRELYRDPLLSEAPPTGDYGAAYSDAVETADGTFSLALSPPPSLLPSSLPPSLPPSLLPFFPPSLPLSLLAPFLPPPPPLPP